mmetsp:Transcript_100419/g.139588  ORF Transcript_100419/g.139588 Transcript_100419/m.139588 type:complete len:275 (-) Transcript_100419:281-1105(-)|eukprot:s2720_g11.t1
MGSSSSAAKQETLAPKPAQLSLPIQNRRTRAVTLSVEPREAVVEVGTGASSAGVCLPIKNRRTRGVILETAEFNPDRLVPPSLNVGRGQDASGGDMTRRAVHNPVGQSLATDSPTALVPRLPSSPAATSSARTSSVPASPSVMSRNSRVHFAASPASVVEITPYSWTSRSSACSPTSPTFDESPTRPATSLSIPQPASGLYASGSLQHTVVIPAVQYVQHYAWTAPSAAAPAIPVVSAPSLPLAGAPVANVAPATVAVSLPKSIAPTAAATWRQ